MARRRYKGDSSVDTFEDYTSLRTPHLRGGLGSSGGNGKVPGKATSSISHPDAATGSASFSTDPGVQTTSALTRFEAIDYWLVLLGSCEVEHAYITLSETDVQRECCACHERDYQVNVQCDRCEMLIHEHCLSKDTEPYPCIYPTPIADINNPNLSECTASLPHGKAKVPAILIKCFYELQRKKRILTENMYETPSSEYELDIDTLSADLLRNVNRDLSDVPTPVIAGCVIKFLSDIREQLLTTCEENALLEMHQNRHRLDNPLPFKVVEFVKENILDLCRLHTLAALILHLHTIEKYQLLKGQRKPTFPGLTSVLGALEILYNVDPSFWSKCLNADIAPGRIRPPAPAPTPAPSRLKRLQRFNPWRRHKRRE